MSESESKIDVDLATAEVVTKRRGVFPTWIDLLAILGLFFLSQSLTTILAIMLGWQFTLPENFVELSSSVQRAMELDMGYSTFLWSIVAQPLMLFLVLLYRAIRRGGWADVKFSVNGFNPSILLLGVVLLVSLVIIMEPLMMILPEMPEPDGRGAYMILAMLFVAPIFEELLCRGIILEAVRSKYNAWIACFVSALIFAVMHIHPQAVVNAFVLGLLLGYIYLRTNSIFAPIILHSINNIFAYIFLLFDVGDLSLSEMIGTGSLYTMIYLGAVGIMLLSMISISRRMKGIEKMDRERKSATMK